MKAKNVKTSEVSSWGHMDIGNLAFGIGAVALLVALLYVAFCTNFFRPTTVEEKRVNEHFQDAKMAQVILAQMVQEEKNSLGDVDVRWYEDEYGEAFRDLQDEVEKAPEGAVSPRVRSFIQHNVPSVSAMMAGDGRW